MHTILEVVTYIPDGESAESWCQPHTVDHYCDLLGVPSNWHSVNGKERNRCRQVAWDRGHFKHHEIKDGQTGEVLGYDDKPHHHIVLEGTDEFELSQEQHDKLCRAIEAGECLPRPVWYDCDPVAFSTAIDALRFPGHEVARGDHGKHGLRHDHGGCSFVADPVGKLGIVYCCYECKCNHDDRDCKEALAGLPDPARRPLRNVLRTIEHKVELPEALLTADGRKITHKIVKEDILEDKERYLKRLHDYYKAAGCLTGTCERC